METLLSLFRRKVTAAVHRAFGDSLSEEERFADMAPCMQEEFGHYQCNSALRLSKILKLRELFYYLLICHTVHPIC